VKRLVGFPLCDEIDLITDLPNIKSKGSERHRVVKFLKDRELDLDAAESMKYS
jgi:hypothetical protein